MTEAGTGLAPPAGMLVPSLSRDTVSVAAGILGAVIMPHNLFLHSALVHSRWAGGRA